MWVLALAAFAVGSLVGLLLLKERPVASKTEWVARPADIQIVDSYRVPEATRLTFAVKAKNISQVEFDAKVSGDVYIGGRYSARCEQALFGQLVPGADSTALVECPTLDPAAIREDVRFQPLVLREVRLPPKQPR